MVKKDDVLRSNIAYLLECKNKMSLGDGSSINRTTIYKTLEGNVVRVQ